MCIMRLPILSCLLLLVVAFDAAASDVYRTINRLRQGQGSCEAQGLAPLKRQAALDRVGRDLARGSELEHSLEAARYRATRAKSLKFGGKGIAAKMKGLLARPDYCDKWQDAAMTDIGIYQDARQVWIVLAAPFAPAAALDADAGARVLELVNQARGTRRHCGDTAFKAAPPLRWNRTLAQAAQRHADDMARLDFISHDGRDGSTAAQRIERAGYRYRAMGENIAGGQTRPEDAVAGWIASPGHCANLMNSAFTEMGVAVAVNRRSKMGVYWTLEFGTPR